MRTITWIFFAGALLAAVPGDACTSDPECYSFDPCQVNQRCQGGVCASDPRNCDDGEPCTTDTCTAGPGGPCVHTPYCGVNSACGEQMACLLLPIGFPNPVFIPYCVSLGPTNCDDQTVCTNDVCYEPDGCQHVPVSCDDADVCTLDECDPVAGCSHTPLLGCCNLDAECANDQCLLGAQCTGHACGGGTARNCDDGDACTDDRCNPADGCNSRQKEGFDSLACICDRAAPASCAGVGLPRPVTRRLGKSCALIDAARTADAPKARKLVGRVAKQMKKAQKIVQRAGKKLGAACAGDEAALLDDGRARAEAVRQTL